MPNRHFSLIGLCVLFVNLLLITAGSASTGTLPTLEDLQPGQWNSIEPGGDTVCAYDSTYQFFVRPSVTPSDKLMIYFQGGGACWDAGTCSAEASIFKQTASADEANENAGIFDYDNPENPVSDYNAVFVSYCTGDVHTGSQTHDYSSGGQSYTIHHNGFINARAVLDWTYTHFPNPSDVLITGTSAGAVGMVVHTPYILDHYAASRTTFLADSYVGAIPSTWRGYESWGLIDNLAADIIPAYADLTVENFSIARLYGGMAAVFPETTFAGFTTAFDQVQLLYFMFQGDSGDATEARESWLPIKDSILDDLIANVPNFRLFQAWGTLHGILPARDFYRYQVDGVRFRDWAAELIAGNPVENVSCSDCTATELYAPTS